MKLAIVALVTIGCLIAAVRSAEEEYDYEEESAAPITPAPARSNSARLGGLLSPRGRTSVGRKTPSATTVQSTTAKAVEQSVEVDDEGDENLDENQDQQEDSPTTTTESPKKVRGGVRPFRSNQDLLAALKRRRAQAGTNGQRESAASQTVTETTTPKSKGTTHSRSKGNGASENTSKSSGRGRFGGTRGSNKPLQEEVEETQREEVQVKPKPYRRG